MENNSKVFMKRLSENISKLEEVCSEMEFLMREINNQGLLSDKEISSILESKTKSVEFFTDRISRTFKFTRLEEVAVQSTEEEIEVESENPVLDDFVKMFTMANKRSKGRRFNKYDRMVSFIKDHPDCALGQFPPDQPFQVTQNIIDLVRSGEADTGDALYMHLLLGGDGTYISPSAREDRSKERENIMFVIEKIKTLDIFEGTEFVPTSKEELDFKAKILEADVLNKLSELSDWSLDRNSQML